ncbi:MAG: stage V sporulation protein AC [Clostridia bacterium]|nr:stage V sporulation protein AC [Clostridia bacterium]
MKNNMTKAQYNEYVKTKVPKSPVISDCIKAFLVGGIICTVGEVFIKLYMSIGLSLDTSRTATSITLIFISALLTGLNIYPKIGKFGGAGSIVPITGFANSVVSPAIEAKPEGYVLGVGAKIFSIAGPVILFGTIASMIAGIIYYVI